MLKRALSPASLLSVELDWILWNVAEQDMGSLPPHHRTLTIYY